MTSTNDTHEPDTHRTDDRLALLDVEEGALVYDRHNPDAWIESDAWVSLSERR